MSSPHPAASNLGGRLALEWSRLRRCPRALRNAERWQITEGPLHDLDRVLLAVGYDVPATPSTEDNMRNLIDAARTDDLAARVVIQRILPGLLAVVARRRRMGEPTNALDELLGAAWIDVRTFNLDRRPSCLAAALIADADYRAFRSTRRRRSSTERPVDLSGDAAPARPAVIDPSPSDELAELLALAVDSGLPGADITLIRQLLDTPKVIELARRMNVTPRTIRNRRDRVTHRLREVALAA